jgi:hypothetical protein
MHLHRMYLQREQTRQPRQRPRVFARPREGQKQVDAGRRTCPSR